MTADDKCPRCQGQIAEGKCPACDKADGLLSRMLGRQTTLETFFMEGLVKDMRRSWTMQPLESRRTRMQIILAMAGELAEIRKTTIQATRFCEWAIEGVITGKVRDMEIALSGISFEGEDEEYAGRYRPVFAKFRQITEEAIQSMKALEAASGILS